MIASTSQPKFASLFSGCGGFDLGFELAGFRSLAAYDICPKVVSVFRKNVSETCNVADLATATVSRKTIGQPDVVIAGSPCQGFSTLGLNRIADPRNSLYIRGAQIAIRLSPKVIVLENVTGILSQKMSHHFEAAVQCLNDARYHTKVVQIKCSDLGLPQIRQRVFLVASKAKKSLGEFQITPSRPRSLKDVLSNLDHVANHEPKFLDPKSDEFKIALQIGQHQKLCNVRGGERAVPTWKIPAVFGKTTKQEREVLCLLRGLRRQLRVRATGDADPVRLADLKAAAGAQVRPAVKRLVDKGYIRKVGNRYDLTNTFNGKFRRLAYAHPSPAVDTRFGMPNYFLHPDQNRGFTVREAARIQGFPDDFVFEGVISKQFQMIGNAVPVPVAECIANAIKQYLL